MRTYTIYTAKTHLSQLIEQACAGEEVVTKVSRFFYEPMIQFSGIFGLAGFFS